MDDGNSTDPMVADFIGKLRTLPALYLSHGPTRNKGHSQRESGLGLIRDLGLVGTVYMPDDDNKYCKHHCPPQNMSPGESPPHEWMQVKMEHVVTDLPPCQHK